MGLVILYSRPSSNKRPEAGMSSKVNGISSEAVAARTGKTWSQWLKALDAAGAKKLDHKSIAKLLGEKFRVGAWWIQMVTVGYEQARGMRVKHERPDGFSVSASKMFATPVGRLFRAWKDAKLRTVWLPEPIKIRKATKDRSIRITWLKDDTTVETIFYPKSREKCQVSVQHNRLRSAMAADNVKAFWKRRLEALNKTLSRKG